MQDETQKRFEIVPEALRYRLGWDHRHDAMARLVMDEFALTPPRDRELIRQLAFIRVQPRPPPRRGATKGVTR